MPRRANQNAGRNGSFVSQEHAAAARISRVQGAAAVAAVAAAPRRADLPVDCCQSGGATSPFTDTYQAAMAPRCLTRIQLDHVDNGLIGARS